MIIEFNLEKTLSQYDSVISKAMAIVLKKDKEYNQSWLLFRPFSMLEQLWIKPMRIRRIQEKKGATKIIDEPIEEDFVHIINYAVFGIILVKRLISSEVSTDELEKVYTSVVDDIKQLYKNKTDDYGEAWRDIAISTMVDVMLVKLLRGKAKHEKGKDTPDDLCEIFRDVFNYAVFCLIRIEEGTNPLI